MGWGSPEQQANNVTHLSLEIIEQLKARSMPDGVSEHLARGLQRMSWELEAYLALMRRFDAREFTEVASQLRRPPYQLVALLRDKAGAHFGVVESLYFPRSSASGDAISVDVYLAGSDAARNAEFIERVDKMAEALGCETPTEIDVEYGSIFRRAKAAVKTLFTSQELQHRLDMAEKAIQNRLYEKEQAEIDSTLAQAFESVMNGLTDQPEACVRLGSLLILKYQGENGPIVLTRMLSPTEVKVLEQYPGIQREPSSVLQNLAIAALEERRSGR